MFLYGEILEEQLKTGLVRRGVVLPVFYRNEVNCRARIAK